MATKNNPKPTTKPKSAFAQISSYISHHKLVFILLATLFLFGLSFAYQAYKDWDNAQMIKGLARDFPILVSDIEQATGLELEIKNDCSTTTEKFSAGIKTCELSVAKVADKEAVEAANKRIQNNSIPSSVSLSETGRTLKISYRNKNSCSISTAETVYLSCITAVREANKQLAIDEFSKIPE